MLHVVRITGLSDAIDRFASTIAKQVSGQTNGHAEVGVTMKKWSLRPMRVGISAAEGRDNVCNLDIILRAEMAWQHAFANVFQLQCLVHLVWMSERLGLFADRALHPGTPSSCLSQLPRLPPN